MLRSSQLTESGVRISSRILSRYLLPDERVQVATRQHWARFIPPTVAVIVGFFLIAWITSATVGSVGTAALYLWFVWFALIGRLIWVVLEWRQEWFCATNKRLLLTYGLFTHNVAMMPLRKVTDLNYGRSVTGRALGYGEFTLESAGQDQALRKIRWVPDPDHTYQSICDIVFGPGAIDPDDADFVRPGPHQRAEPSRDPNDPSSDPDRTEPNPRPATTRPNPRQLRIPKS